MGKTGEQIKINLKQLYFISFIEGGVVMVTEIAGAKMLTPFFGASLYSWASTLSITLFALMTGYYFGGYATTKPRFSSSNNVTWVFLISGLTVLLMPSLGRFIMQKTIAFSFFTGLITSGLFFLFLPIFLMGMISPMIIFQITKTAEQSGRSAGNIYAISTSGGILFTLLFGFLIIPAYGISLPVRVLGISVVLIAVFLLAKAKVAAKKTTAVLIVTFILGAITLSHSKPKEFAPGSNLELVEYSEGLLGELKVIDELTYPSNAKPAVVRKLRANNIQQNFVFRDLPSQSLHYYVNLSKQLVKFFPKKESALLVGLGAGSLYSILKDQGMSVETVEIDKRIYDMGIKYFGMPAHENHTITDGRYFINVTNKKYDLIVLDVIIGESVPAQLLTLESFQRCAELLNPGGILLIEQGGVTGFANNSFIPSIVKTLNATGFKVSLYNPILKTDFGDILLVAGRDKFESGNHHIVADVLINEGPLSDYELDITRFDTGNAELLTDDKNSSDAMLKVHYFQIRKSIRKEIAKYGL